VRGTLVEHDGEHQDVRHPCLAYQAWVLSGAETKTLFQLLDTARCPFGIAGGRQREEAEEEEDETTGGGLLRKTD